MLNYLSLPFSPKVSYCLRNVFNAFHQSLEGLKVRRPWRKLTAFYLCWFWSWIIYLVNSGCVMNLIFSQCCVLIFSDGHFWSVWLDTTDPVSRKCFGAPCTGLLQIRSPTLIWLRESPSLFRITAWPLILPFILISCFWSQCYLVSKVMLVWSQAIFISHEQWLLADLFLKASDESI